MKMTDDVIIIGIDSGYGNIKTANCCFPASVSAYDKEPVFKENLLVYASKFYLIGAGHKEFLTRRSSDLLRIRRGIWTTMCWRLRPSRGN